MSSYAIVAGARCMPVSKHSGHFCGCSDLVALCPRLRQHSGMLQSLFDLYLGPFWGSALWKIVSVEVEINLKVANVELHELLDHAFRESEEWLRATSKHIPMNK